MNGSHSFSNMCELLQYLEERDRERVIFTYLSGWKTHAVSGVDFFEQVCRRAFTLEHMGLGGKHIGLMGACRWQWMASLCAVFQIGAVAVLLSPELNGKELSEAATRTDLSAILCDDSLVDLSCMPDIPVIGMDAEPGSEKLERFAVLEPEALACILFTSGTTGNQKAVMFTHRALLAGICHNVIGIPFEAQLAILPLHHIAGFASVLNTWYLGRRICLGEDVIHLYRYLELLKPDYVLTVPSILQAIVKKIQLGVSRGQPVNWNLRLIGCGGADFPRDVLALLRGQHIHVLQSYGATEAGGIGFEWEMTESCLGSIGKPCSEMEVRITDGELFLRSPSVMSGYFGDPEGTAEVLQEGWYATGDLCDMDSEGYLYIRGRKKNLIILSNGENVSPEEIERALAGFSSVEEIMVGLRDGRITAWIYPAAAASCREIDETVQKYNETVPRWKQIVDVEIMEREFAKTALGKQIRASVTEVTGK